MNRLAKSVLNLPTLILLLFIVLFINGGFDNSKTDSPVIKQELKLDIEVKSATGEIGHMTFWTKLYYVGDYMIFGIPSENEYSNVTMNKQGEVLSDTLVKTDTTFTYHVFKSTDKLISGIKYKNLDTLVGHKFNIDSLVELYSHPNFPYFDLNNDTLIHKELVKGALVETHLHLKKKDASFPDSIYFHFNNKLSSKGYTFSKFLDSTRKSKVAKVIYLYNPIDGKVETGKKLSFELTQYDVPEAQKILALIERYKSQVERIKNTSN
ncbi:hypothetical protein CLV32_4562 [Pedobacter duraquae]|uniref:Uncharacterized protein n=2 Tax=Pedobacter duraquae TaxID=425511 RepID=A0A4R6IBK7_9SPHI|nr:hypothetical protein CLV32_4562 [Pedobacter duraquae]